MVALQDLPTRGLLNSSVLDVSRPGIYIADHETRAPSGQVLKFDKQPLLLRSLQSKKDAESRARNKKQQEPVKAKPSAAAKRSGENLQPPDAKRAQTADQAWTLQKLLTKTKTELADILKKSGQKITGKKEELMARVLSSQKQ